MSFPVFLWVLFSAEVWEKVADKKDVRDVENYVTYLEYVTVYVGVAITVWLE